MCKRSKTISTQTAFFLLHKTAGKDCNEQFHELDRREESTTDLINELYGNKGYRIDVVSVKRMINSDASNRVGEEVIICNY